jgi:hypothetical protein
MKMKCKPIRMTTPLDLEKADLGLQTLPLKHVMVYKGTLDSRLGAFALHSHIAEMDKTLVVTFSVHWQDEDAPGQYMRYTFSTDGGKTWSDPYSEKAVLFPKMEKALLNPSLMDENGRIQGCRQHDKCGTGQKSENSWENDNCGHYHLMLCANGFAKVDGKLYAIGEVAKGVNYPGIGRLAREVKSDGSLGPIFWVNENIPNLSEITPHAENAELYAKAPYGGELAKKIASYLADARYMPQWDMDPVGWPLPDGETYRTWRRKFEERYGIPCCEPTYSYEASDGVHIRWWRSKFNIQHAQYSFDQGKTWTEITDTEFPDTGARTNVGNLPSGRVFAIGNFGHKRHQLCLSLSDDGYTFDNTVVLAHSAELVRHRGRAKGHGFHYPHACILNDTLYISYAKNKEDIFVALVPLSELEKL